MLIVPKKKKTYEMVFFFPFPYSPFLSYTTGIKKIYYFYMPYSILLFDVLYKILYEMVFLFSYPYFPKHLKKGQKKLFLTILFFVNIYLKMLKKNVLCVILKNLKKIYFF